MDGIKLSELNSIISNTIKQNFQNQTYWVIADVTNHSRNANNHIHYFELVEKGSTNNIIAKIAGKAWGNGAMRISDFEKQTGQKFTSNLNVLVQVTVDFHNVYGLSLNVVDVDTNFTLGVLEQQRNATLQRLVAENDYIEKRGDFYVTRNNQLSLNTVIQKIALISSSTSAGAEDFKHTLLQNGFGYRFDVDDYFTIVQGENNAKQFLNKLIEVFNSQKNYDAVVIIRGGGAQTDFLIFDNYNIGRAIAKFPIPIITGIGHQKNTTIADLMAHTQTKTPTKCAEFIIAYNRNFESNLLVIQKSIVIKIQQLFFSHSQELQLLRNSLSIGAKEVIAENKDAVARLNQIAINSSKTLIFDYRKNLNLTAGQILTKPKITVYNKISDVKNLRGNLVLFVKKYVHNKTGYLGHYESSIKQLAPENILKKGYAIVKVNDRIASNPNGIKVGDNIDIILADTLLKSTVKQKEKYDGRDFNI